MQNKENIITQYNKKQQSSTLKALISGGCVLTEMSLAGIFMENLKMEKQRTSLPYPTLARNLLGQGLKGFHAGLFPWGCILGFGKGFVLGGAKSEITKHCNNYGLDKNTTTIVSGFGAGAVQGAFMSPISLARIRINQSITERLTANPGLKLNWRDELKLSATTLNRSIQNEGFGVLTKGLPTMIAKRSADWGTRFCLVDQIRRTIEEEDKPLTDAQKLGSVFLGGSLSVLMTMPIDRLLPVIQQAGRDSNKSVVSIMKDKFRSEGPATFFRGLGVRTIQTGWHTTFALFVADKVYSMFEDV